MSVKFNSDICTACSFCTSTRLPYSKLSLTSVKWKRPKNARSRNGSNTDINIVVIVIEEVLTFVVTSARLLASDHITSVEQCYCHVAITTDLTAYKIRTPYFIKIQFNT